MALDKENDAGDLEDYGEELSSDYREEEEESAGEEGEELGEEVSYETEETSGKPRQSSIQVPEITSGAPAAPRVRGAKPPRAKKPKKSASPGWFSSQSQERARDRGSAFSQARDPGK